MSKTTGKRGFVRTQASVDLTPAGKRPAEWAEAVAAYEAAERTHDEACAATNGHLPPPAETLAGFCEARDRLISTPAPNGAALALKFAAYVQMTSGEAIGRPEDQQWIAEHGSEEDRAALAVYFDALALSGVAATVVPPAVPGPADVVGEYVAARDARSPYLRALEANEDAPEVPEAIDRRFFAARDALYAAPAKDLRAVALKVGRFAMGLDGIDVDSAEERAEAIKAGGIGQMLVETYERLEALAAKPISEVEPMEWVQLCFSTESLGHLCAAEQWPQYAVNPRGLAELVTELTSFQEDMRSLAHDHAPGAMGIAIDAIHFGRTPWDRPPPKGPGGGMPLAAPATDDDTRRVVRLDVERRKLAAQYDAADDPADATFSAQLAAENALRAAPCTSLASAVIKLRHFAEGYTKGWREDDAALLGQVIDFLSAGVGPTGAREAWDDAARELLAISAASPDTSDEATISAWVARHAAAVDRLLALAPPDLEGWRLLFDVIMTETQALGLRSGATREGGSGPPSHETLADACGWPTHQPCVFIENGTGLAAGLVHLRRALDTLCGTPAPYPVETDAEAGEASQGEG